MSLNSLLVLCYDELYYFSFLLSYYLGNYYVNCCRLGLHVYIDLLWDIHINTTIILVGLTRKGCVEM